MTGNSPTVAPEKERPADPFAELVQRAREGDDSAARQLLEQVAPRVQRVVRSVLGAHNADVDDVTQESLIGLVRAIGAFRGDCSFVGYASRIAARTAIASRKRSHKTESKRGDFDEARSVPDSKPPPSERAVAERRKEIFRDLLEDLPEAQAETMVLRIVLGHSLNEVAEATGAPLNTVRSRLRLAREALKKRIESDPKLREEFEVLA